MIFHDTKFLDSVSSLGTTDQQFMGDANRPPSKGWNFTPTSSATLSTVVNARCAVSMASERPVRGCIPV